VRIRSNDLKDMIRVALAAEKIEDASRVNAGREERITLNQAAEIMFNLVG
jgi:hypothetical protein